MSITVILYRPTQMGHRTTFKVVFFSFEIKGWVKKKDYPLNVLQDVRTGLKPIRTNSSPRWSYLMSDIQFHTTTHDRNYRKQHWTPLLLSRQAGRNTSSKGKGLQLTKKKYQFQELTNSTGNSID